MLLFCFYCCCCCFVVVCVVYVFCLFVSFCYFFFVVIIYLVLNQLTKRQIMRLYGCSRSTLQVTKKRHFRFFLIICQAVRIKHVSCPRNYASRSSGLGLSACSISNLRITSHCSTLFQNIKIKIILPRKRNRSSYVPLPNAGS